MDRRQFLTVAGGAVLGVAITPWIDAQALYATAPGPFRHGVASGDPLATQVIIWTRVTPSATASPGSGVGPPVTVSWKVATDPTLRNVVARGSVRVSSATDHTVKLDVTGLRPATTYYYRFFALDRQSPIGRTRTAPRADADVDSLRLGLVSCANWEAGYFSAYRHLAQRNDLDLVVHVGDYLYEYGPGAYGDAKMPRRHVPAHEIVTLADYRARHGQYKTDADLQLLHANYPWVTTWDDHETANDSWKAGAENHTPVVEGTWVNRRRAAYQAYLEWMPVRAPRSEIRLYRRLVFGRLVDLTMLDLRSFRDQQVAPPGGGALDDPARTITGDAQMEWLKQQLSSSGCTWRLLGNSVMITPVVFPPLPELLGRRVSDVTGLFPEDGLPYNVDQWDGYQADRDELLDHLRGSGVANAVFLTGDIHTSWACDVPLDAGTYAGSPNVMSPSGGIEIVCPSVTSDNLDEIAGVPPRTASLTVEAAFRATNRHIKLVEMDSHGYTVVEVDRNRLHADWWYISDRTDPDATARFAYAIRSTTGSSTVEPTTRSLSSRAVSFPPLV